MQWVTKNWENLAKIDEEKAFRLQQEYLDRLIIKQQEKELQESLGLNYRYFRFDVLVGEFWWDTSVSVGWRIDEGVLRYAYALQSKKDHFSRTDARRYINDRFNNHQMHWFAIDESMRGMSVDILIALHYNTLHRLIIGVPKYLKYIPLQIGDCA